jgi:inositol hexakisphosphate/diphosphoinositol-pentakisphosphate kinase
LVYKRWYKLQKDLYDNKTDKYNISKIPDIYDSIAYDMKHNRNVIEKMYPKCDELYELAKELAYFVVPN